MVVIPPNRKLGGRTATNGVKRAELPNRKMSEHAPVSVVGCPSCSSPTPSHARESPEGQEADPALEAHAAALAPAHSDSDACANESAADEDMSLRWPFLMYDMPTIMVEDDAEDVVKERSKSSCESGNGGLYFRLSKHSCRSCKSGKSSCKSSVKSRKKRTTAEAASRSETSNSNTNGSSSQSQSKFCLSPSTHVCFVVIYGF